MRPWSAPASRRGRRGQRGPDSWRSHCSSADPRFRFCVQRGELGHLEEVLYFPVAGVVLTGPSRESVEGHHVGPALPGKARQSLAAELPFSIAAVDEYKLDFVRVTIARPLCRAMGRLQ